MIKVDKKTGKEGLILAAILLFGKDDVIFKALPTYRTDAIYRVKNLDRYDDRDDIRTNLIESFDRLMAFVDKHLNDMFYIEDNKRIDIRNKIAREVISNLLIHREFISGFPAKLIIEKDKMWTENASKSKKVGKIDIKNFSPYSKNPKIAKFFREIGLADELGSGVRNTTKYTKIYSGGVPIFDETDDDVFKTIIPLKEIINVAYTESYEVTDDTLNIGLNVGLNLSDIQKRILNQIKHNNKITQKQIAEELNVTSRTIERETSKLQRLNILKREGSKKNGYWKIIKKD